MKRFERIVVVGSVGFDRIMNLPGKFADWIMPDKIHQLNVSFTVETLREEFGGTGGNCAYTLGLLGVKPLLIGYLGMDGSGYLDHLRSSGVIVNKVKLDKMMLSACGHVMTDQTDNQIWSYYPGPLTKLKKIKLKGIIDQKKDFVALLPSEPTAFKSHLEELVDYGAHFLFDPAFFIPNLTKAELLRGIKAAEIIIGNDYEVGLMEHRVNQKISKILKTQQILIKTLGEKGSEIYTGGKLIKIEAAKVKVNLDPTGAGDAYRAGFLAGYIKGEDLETCGRMGSVAAAYTVEKYGTQTHKFTMKKFEKRMNLRI